MRRTVLFLVLLALPVPALAAPDAATPKRGDQGLKTHRSGDAVTFCGGLDPDSPEMGVCFKKNTGQLSENRRRALTAYRAADGK